MSRIEFKKQTGCVSPYIIISSDDDNIRGQLASVYKESQLLAVDIKMVSAEIDSVYNVKKMTFGLGAEYQVDDISDDYNSSTFFAADTSYVYLMINNTTANVAVLSGGITANGDELFSNQAIAASGITLIRLDKAFASVTPFYLHANGEGDTWNGAVISIKPITLRS